MSDLRSKFVRRAGAVGLVCAVAFTSACGMAGPDNTAYVEPEFRPKTERPIRDAADRITGCDEKPATCRKAARGVGWLGLGVAIARGGGLTTGLESYISPP